MTAERLGRSGGPRPFVVQVDGLSGTGKSSLAAELAARGHRAVDADSAFAYCGDPITGQPSELDIREHWIWDLDGLRSYCDHETEEITFVCGGAMNQHRCGDLFGLRLLLVVDDQTLLHRLLTRTTNDYGKDPDELTEQVVLNRTAADEGRRSGFGIVDATRPLAEVADDVVRLSAAVVRRRP